MSDITKTLREMLLDTQQITDMVQQRVSADMQLQNGKLPAVVLWSVSSTGNDCLAGAVSVINTRVQFNCYGNNREEANELATLIRQRLHGFRGVFNGQQIMAITMESGERHMFDRPLAGTQKITPVTVLEFNVFYRVSTTLPTVP